MHKGSNIKKPKVPEATKFFDETIEAADISM